MYVYGVGSSKAKLQRANWCLVVFKVKCMVFMQLQWNYFRPTQRKRTGCREQLDANSNDEMVTLREWFWKDIFDLSLPILNCRKHDVGGESLGMRLLEVDCMLASNPPTRWEVLCFWFFIVGERYPYIRRVVVPSHLLDSFRTVINTQHVTLNTELPLNYN